MSAKKDNPGVAIPPPLIYAAIFFLSVFLQREMPIDNSFFNTQYATDTGYVLIAISLMFTIPALIKFAKTKNTLITIKPASSLQTTGIYRITRNPMYVGLLILYSGIGMLAGKNWWTFILILLIVFIIQAYVIHSEENYLQREFGEDYAAYRKKVRRWI